MIKEIIFNGQSGRLEGKYYQSIEKFAPAALILHPHPLYGGTMNNKVVFHTFHTFKNNNFSVLRFNFRGVEKSLGTFDNGNGELIDAATAMDWLQSKNPEAASYWIAGFSFGSWVSMQLLMRRPDIDGFVAISPPVTDYDFNFLSPCPTPGIIIQGNRDIIARESDTYNLYQRLSKQRNSLVDYITIDGADHFFTDYISKLNTVINDYIKPRINRRTQPKKIRRDRKRKIVES